MYAAASAADWLDCPARTADGGRAICASVSASGRSGAASEPPAAGRSARAPPKSVSTASVAAKARGMASRALRRRGREAMWVMVTESCGPATEAAGPRDRSGGRLRDRGVPRLRPLGQAAEAVVRQGDVGERGPERQVVLVDAVAERDLLAALLGLQQRAGDHAQLDVGHVVAEATAVREAGGVTGQRAEAVRGRARRDAEVELERVGRSRVLRDLRQAGEAGQQRLHDVGAVVLLHAEAEQGVEELRRLGVQGERPEVAQVVARRGRVELVLLPDRDDD